MVSASTMNNPLQQIRIFRNGEHVATVPANGSAILNQATASVPWPVRSVIHAWWYDEIPSARYQYDEQSVYTWELDSSRERSVR